MDRLIARGDSEYFEARAEQELRRALSAEHPAAARSHYQLARHYFYRASDDRPLRR